MPQTKPTLPEPPEFPASNASYNKIVGKMHKAALSAATCEAAIVAVSMCKDAVGGINTYAKASRRYADKLLVALGVPAEAAPAVAEGAAKAAKAEKPAMPQLTKADEKRATKAAAEATLSNFGASYSNKSNAKRALAKAACDHLPVEWEPDGERVRPVLLVDDSKGYEYATERGFKAKVAA